MTSKNKRWKVPASIKLAIGVYSLGRIALLVSYYYSFLMQIIPVLTILVVVTALGFVATHSFVQQVSGAVSGGDDFCSVKGINGDGKTVLHCLEEHNIK
jgi:hypothetical protein